MTFFFDPSKKKDRTPLTFAMLGLDKSFIIGVSSDNPNFNTFGVWFASGAGTVDEVKSSGLDVRKYKITPRVPGVQTLVSGSSASATDGTRLRIEVVQPKHAAEDMVYTGQRLTWFQNLPKGATELIDFPATSGLPDSQLSSQERVVDHGPIPEGLYTFWARRDRHRLASIMNEKGDLDTRDGIQILPHHMPTPKHKKTLSFPGWGSHRVRLTPTGWNAAPARGGFYLHDSHKGFSHGCIEVPQLFPVLLKYADGHQGPEWLKVRVSYSDDAVVTSGNTLTPVQPGEYDKPSDD